MIFARPFCLNGCECNSYLMYRASCKLDIEIWLIFAINKLLRRSFLVLFGFRFKKWANVTLLFNLFLTCLLSVINVFLIVRVVLL